jgi:peptidylprolyl isomerase
MTTPCPEPDGSSPKLQRFDGPPPMCIDPDKRYTAAMATSKGDMVIALDPIAAPKTVNNFVFLARYHYYEGIVFHRVIPGFVLQGGDPTGTGRGGPGYQFEDELPKPGRYELGSLAMANAGPNTNGSQFFVISGPSGVRLPPQYSLFGKVIDGLDVVATVDALGTQSGQPKELVTINSVTITESDWDHDDGRWRGGRLCGL